MKGVALTGLEDSRQTDIGSRPQPSASEQSPDHPVAKAHLRVQGRPILEHILEGLLIALDNLDAVIKLIRGSADADVARDGLMENFELTRPQAQAILDMRLQRLTALESDKIRAEHAELMELITTRWVCRGRPWSLPSGR